MFVRVLTCVKIWILLVIPHHNTHISSPCSLYENTFDRFQIHKNHFSRNFSFGQPPIKHVYVLRGRGRGREREKRIFFLRGGSTRLKISWVQQRQHHRAQESARERMLGLLLRRCETYSQCVSLAPPRAPLNLSLLHSIVFHMLLRPFIGNDVNVVTCRQYSCTNKFVLNAEGNRKNVCLRKRHPFVCTSRLEQLNWSRKLYTFEIYIIVDKHWKPSRCPDISAGHVPLKIFITKNYEPHLRRCYRIIYTFNWMNREEHTFLRKNKQKRHLT